MSACVSADLVKLRSRLFRLWCRGSQGRANNEAHEEHEKWVFYDIRGESVNIPVYKPAYEAVPDVWGGVLCGRFQSQQNCIYVNYGK